MQRYTGNSCDCYTVSLYVILQNKKGTGLLIKHKTNTIYRLAPPTSDPPTHLPQRLR